MRIFCFLACASLLLPLTGVGQTVRRTPVLVELFTSEGCSSCPPADALLARLDKEQPVAGAEIIVLEEHVDYWDGLGWHDRFSSAQFTNRQKAYGTRFNLDDVFTPQMVVGGVRQFVGSDGGTARKAIQQAAEGGAIQLEFSGVKVDGRKVSALVGFEGTAPAAKGDLYAALVDPMQTTEVRKGENGGRTLHHAGVVRTLSRVGSLKDLARGPVEFSIEGPGKIEGMRLVVFAQGVDAGPILGAVSRGMGVGMPVRTMAKADSPRE
jgi:hypothetical protein